MELGVKKVMIVPFHFLLGCNFSHLNIVYMGICCRLCTSLKLIKPFGTKEKLIPQLLNLHQVNMKKICLSNKKTKTKQK